MKTHASVDWNPTNKVEMTQYIFFVTLPFV